MVGCGPGIVVHLVRAWTASTARCMATGRGPPAAAREWVTKKLDAGAAEEGVVALLKRRWLW